VVVDAGRPRNGPAKGIQGFLTRDGMPPAELQSVGTQEVQRYGGVVRAGTVTSVDRTETAFTVHLHDGSVLHSRKILVATGLKDALPDVEGLEERWGKDVLQCPYCHGWEVRDNRIGVLAHPDFPTEQVLLFRQWSAEVSLFLQDCRPLTVDERERLDAVGIQVVDGCVERLEVQDDRLVGVRLTDGSTHPLDVLALEPEFLARTDGLESLGLTPRDHPMGKVLHCSAPAECAAPGVWVAGNVTDLGGQVVGAAADGARAGIGINAELLEEDVQRAVEERRRAAAAAAAAQGS
jgi:thioredoxin reductase